MAEDFEYFAFQYLHFVFFYCMAEDFESFLFVLHKKVKIDSFKN